MPHSTPVPPEIVRKWQEIVDLTAEIMHVPSALIMRVEPPNIKVFVSSETKGNPYERDEVAPLNTGLYCETVMKTRQPLLVPDALRDEQWQSNPDIKLGMISYLGVPIVWPDGEVFGTICVLDKKPNEYSELYRKLLLQWRDVLQADLRSLATLHRELEARETKIRRLVEVDIIGSSSGISKVKSLRPTMRFSTLWDTTVRILPPAACIGPISHRRNGSTAMFDNLCRS